ncbi:hypothetical protein KY290_007781 [Solanum tuberosum]|uniref:Integrase core domain containing protein n=1 Tax=Solanum tuberosum TaxID=4113 RepID=A0ABQ7W8Q1_SOLTU|nr:hypothetical protein KY290_007781 [Solanum tuberosum]
MAQAFSLPVQDEHQREIKPSNHFDVESIALHIGSSNPSQSYRTNFSSNHTRNGSQIPYKDIFCTYCRRTEHLMEKCYQLYGYPSGPNSNNNTSIPNQNNYLYNNPAPNAPKPTNFLPNPPQNNTPHRYNRGPGNRPVVNAHCTHDSAPETEPSVDQHEELYNVSLTKDQYGQFQSILQQFHREHETEGSNTSSALANGSADFAGITIHLAQYLPYPMLIALPNGYKVKVTQIDDFSRSTWTQLLSSKSNAL